MDSPSFTHDNDFSLVNEVLQTLLGPPNVSCSIFHREQARFGFPIARLQMWIDPGRDLRRQSRNEVFVKHNALTI